LSHRHDITLTEFIAFVTLKLRIAHHKVLLYRSAVPDFCL
jgi:hypothetical protein